MNIDYNKITNVEIEDIFRFDYPDFCDAFIASADYDGKPMSEDMIDYLNENDSGFIGETIFDNQLYL
jgi:hypothetical protein|tara:strand:- start:681 stop:881 length:201 start_codon:yes stop_codon:yes gene_type:complete